MFHKTRRLTGVLRCRGPALIAVPRLARGLYPRGLHPMCGRPASPQRFQIAARWSLRLHQPQAGRRTALTGPRRAATAGATRPLCQAYRDGREGGNQDGFDDGFAAGATAAQDGQ